MKYHLLALIAALVSPPLRAAEIHDAVSSGDTARVEELLKQSPALASVKDDREDMPLHLAAKNGWVEIIGALLAAGAEVNAKGRHAWTPLHYAAKGGSIGSCRLLLQRGADRTALNEDQKTSLQVAGVFTASVVRDFVPRPEGADKLFQAIEAGDAEQVKSLLAAHPKILETKDDDGRTPLLLAAKSGRAPIVRMLLEGGASTAARGKENVSALYYAVTTDSVETTHALIEAGVDINAQDDAGFTALATAVERHKSAQVSALLAHGPNLEIAIKDSYTPLLLAVGYGYTDLVEMLLKAGAKPTAVMGDGSNALHRAAMAGNRILEQPGFKKGEAADYAAITKLLLAAGVPVDSPERHGYTPLHIAATWGSLDTARLLIAKGAKVNAPSNVGSTPLHLAAMTGSPEVIALLLDQGAAIDAIQTNHPSRTTPMLLAAEFGNAENLKLLLKRGASLKARAFSNRATALHNAARANRVEAARILLEAGMKVDAPDADGAPPLMVAANEGSREVAAFLIEKGANVNFKARSGITVLKVANQTGHAEIAALLKAHGAKE